MNPIAAHKDEFKQLLEKLSSGTAVSGITFVTSLDAYLARLATNCSGIKERVNPPPAQRKWRINMEPTLTQNCALYYAQHKTSKGRAALFRKFRAAARTRRGREQFERRAQAENVAALLEQIAPRGETR